MENFYLEQLLRLKKNFSIKIITGVRGVGKSTLLKAFTEKLRAEGVASEEIIFIDCAADTRPKNFQRLYDFVVKKTSALEKFFLLIDEADNVVECEKALNALFVGAPAEIYVTSSSGTFAEKISALLPNNCDELKIYPPSFAAFAKNFPSEDSPKLLQKYLHFGSLPVTYGANEKFLQTIAAYEIIFDLIEKNSLGNAKLFRLMINSLAKNVGKPTSVRKLFIEHTDDFYLVRKYRGICSELFIEIPKVDIKAGKILRGVKKFYCVDNGLLRALKDFGDVSETTLMENAVCIELLRRGFDVSFGKFGAMNVSFAATRGDEKIFIQVMPPDGSITARRITRPLRELPDDGEKILISMTPQKMTPKKVFVGIQSVTLEDFLSKG